jgi:hypothetical protein
MDRIHRDPGAAGNLADGFHRCGTGDFKIVLQGLFP